MSRHLVSDEVLRTSVGLRVELGVDMSEIRGLIHKFVPEGQGQVAIGEAAGFLSVADVPQHLRAEFLVELSSMSGPPGYRYSSRKAPLVSATDIWG